MKISRLEDLETWRFWDFEFWKSWDLEILRLEGSDVLRIWDLKIRRHGDLMTWRLWDFKTWRSWDLKTFKRLGHSKTYISRFLSLGDSENWRFRKLEILILEESKIEKIDGWVTQRFWELKIRRLGDFESWEIPRLGILA